MREQNSLHTKYLQHIEKGKYETSAEQTEKEEVK